jgi:menaquinone-9 beta-reductase
VLLLERSRFPRHKVCGEFVSAESLGLLADLLSSDFQHLISDAPRISETRIFVDGTTLQTGIDPPAASIARFDLDSALWNSCIEGGIECRAETTVRSVEGERPFRIVTDSRVFEGRALINASGRWSSFTSSAVRARSGKQKWVGIKAHFNEPTTCHSIDLYFFEGGYCGVQPVAAASNGFGTRINACAMVRADVANTMPDVFKQHPVLFERSRSWTSVTESVSTSPLVFHEPEPVQDAMLQIGDAATFVDPFIGDGISLALRSGVLAAGYLHYFFRGACSLEQAAALYDRTYRERLSHIFTVSSILRGLLRWPRIVRRPMFSLASRTPYLTRQIVRMTR